MVNCGHCNREIDQNYCPHCGNPARLPRIDSHYIRHEITHVLHLEKGIFYTIRELILRPGKNVRRFIAEDRSRLVRPILLIILSSLAYTLVNKLVHHHDAPVPPEIMQGTATYAIQNWVNHNYGYSNILMGVFIAFWIRIFFRKSSYNFFEILILLCFAISISMLLYAASTILEGITHFSLFAVTTVLALIYCSWAIGQFFNQGTFSGYLKAFTAYVLGMITFTLVATILGIIIDLMLMGRR